jgi:arylsulfatase A-like enzyme
MRRNTTYRLIAPILLAASCLCASPSHAAQKPNVLWITSEDNSPYLGCYGDELARTPNLDRLAAEGVRYRNAFANAPVCSSARSTLITGMHACSLGVHNHRSGVAIPASFRFYPGLLRDAGYYCTNNSKTDYNVQVDGKRSPTFFWDESSGRAHYQNRKPGQPFFAVFNTTYSHEGQTTDKGYAKRREQGVFPPKRIVPPEAVRLPPYHADTPIVRENWSRYYDNLWLMDQEVGKRLRELEESRLADDTIVFYYSDHGGALPRGKRNIHDSGTRVPLIIRFPKKWAHLAPAEPGAWIDAPVSFVDFPATLLSLAGVPIPENYEGKAFLGKQARAQDHVFLFRARMDERYDTVRAIRTREYLYVNNFAPHRPWGQFYSYPFRVMPSMQAWYDEFAAGRCNPVQARYWQEKPGEEFYVIADDPFQVNNLVDDPQHARAIADLRETLRKRIVETRDAGLIPEGMYPELTGDGTVYEYAQSNAYPIETVLEVATMATSREAAKLPELIAAMDDAHPVVRYWAATGCLVLGDKAAPAKPRLLALLDDPAADVRVVAAEALSHLGEVEPATRALTEVLETGNEYEILAAITVLELFARSKLLPAERVKALVPKKPPGVAARVYDWIQSLD